MSWSSNIDIREGKINEAWINYNSNSNDLCVAFTVFGENITIRQSLSVNVNLIDFLPDWVTLDSQPQQEVLMLYILFILGILVQVWK